MLGVVFGLQTLGPLIEQWPLMTTPIGLTIVVGVLGTLALAGLAALFRQWTAPIFGLFAGVYLLALLCWPIAVGPLPASQDVPWIYYLCNVATGYAVVAFPRRWVFALAYTIVATATLGLIRSVPSGGSATPLAASLDAIYCFLIGLVMLVIIVSLRQAARAVDQAQGYALESYATAVRHHATENERVRVDALVHDNVLITLLSAARARTAETKALAVRMAKGAIDHLNEAQSTFPSVRTDVRIEELVGRLRLAVAEQTKAFDVHIRVQDDIVMASVVADALAEAATQAMVNSVIHAGRPERPVSRSVRLTTRGGVDPEIRIEVSDDGAGFDMARVPAERLGVRTSIIERVVHVGGDAGVDSTPGVGTTVTLRWPAEPAIEVVPGAPVVSELIAESRGDRS
ncbi:hypothetical protein L3i23_03690 [Herbiconiux sp. L3-i23]|nr:hypothetical protein L3i23_03690 [Herbiconiux sp. L3-i23]